MVEIAATLFVVIVGLSILRGLARLIEDENPIAIGVGLLISAIFLYGFFSYIYAKNLQNLPVPALATSAFAQH
jgi:hypothetical protein